MSSQNNQGMEDVLEALSLGDDKQEQSTPKLPPKNLRWKSKIVPLKPLTEDSQATQTTFGFPSPSFAKTSSQKKELLLPKDTTRLRTDEDISTLPEGYMGNNVADQAPAADWAAGGLIKPKDMATKTTRSQNVRWRGTIVTRDVVLREIAAEDARELRYQAKEREKEKKKYREVEERRMKSAVVDKKEAIPVVEFKAKGELDQGDAKDGDGNVGEGEIEESR